jgi:hypothetical protein
MTRKSSLVAKERPIRRFTPRQRFRFRLDARSVMDRVVELLLASEVAFGGLDGRRVQARIGSDPTRRRPNGTASRKCVADRAGRASRFLHAGASGNRNIQLGGKLIF